MVNIIKNKIEDILDEKSIVEGMTYHEAECYFGRKPDVINGEEWIYFIEKKFFGLITRKLHLYFQRGKVHDFYVG